MASLFQVMSKLASLDSEEIESNAPCAERLQRIELLNSVVRKPQGDLICMATDAGTATKVAGEPDDESPNPTHAVVMFIINKEEYLRVNAELDAAAKEATE